MERRRRTAPRLAVLVAYAAVAPALLLSACSSGGSGGSGPDGKASAASGGTSSSTAAQVAAAKYGTLPNACKAVTASTVTALVPRAKNAGGHAAQTSDMQSRGGCSWTGNGTDGYQYRWLSVTLQRFTSDPQLGSGEERAGTRYTEQVRQLDGVPGFTASTLHGTGDQASSVVGRATLAKITSQNDTVVARTGNVVVIVEYDGAGLEGKSNPSASTIVSGAQRAAQDAVAAVAAANG